MTGKYNRRFINAVFWIFRTGAPWRDLPSDYGDWKNVHRRFASCFLPLAKTALYAADIFRALLAGQRRLGTTPRYICTRTRPYMDYD